MTHSPTILIVDDDEGHAILIRENLEAAGLLNRIKHFRDGQAVLDFLFKSPPPAAGAYLVLLDIRMPKVDGIEVLRRIKAAPKLRRLPVVMLTTADDSREVERCHELGCNVYLQKPVDYERFSEAIRRLGHLVPLLAVPQL
ncbi:MAG: response regulator, partial [Verrucomicrobia bacterium]|nr:response regulator [Verrucomicrobiota bacterium]